MKDSKVFIGVGLWERVKAHVAILDPEEQDAAIAEFVREAVEEKLRRTGSEFDERIPG